MQDGAGNAVQHVERAAGTDRASGDELVAPGLRELAADGPGRSGAVEVGATATTGRTTAATNRAMRRVADRAPSDFAVVEEQYADVRSGRWDAQVLGECGALGACDRLAC